MGSKSQEKIIVAISGRTTFVVNNMSGRRVGDMSTYSTGEMLNVERAQFLADKPEYVVWSYGTPIAWVGPRGRKFVTGAKYGATTSQHIGIVKRAFGTYETH